MAKAVSAKVSKTSGQGVSRRSYQTAYELGNRGTGGASDFRGKVQPPSTGRDYAKGKSSSGKVSTGYTHDSYRPTDLTELNELFRDRPKSGIPDKRGDRKVLK